MAKLTLQDRMMIQELTQAGDSQPQIAARLGCARETVRYWRRKVRRGEEPGGRSVLGRPAGGALGTFLASVTDLLAFLRAAHPGWGPKTLLAELRLRVDPGETRLPARSSIARFLKERGLIAGRSRRSNLPAPRTASAQAPHQEWEMDARGPDRVRDVGVVSLIDINDVFSRVKVLSYPCLVGVERVTRHPTTEDYQLALRLAFTDWGLPDRLAVDHESIFFDNTSRSPFPTRLHLWLLALGVELTFGRVGQPTDQAITERSHQTWFHQVVRGVRFSDWEALRAALDERRRFLNHHLGCASLGERPPLVAHPRASIPRRLYGPQWEADLLDLSRVDAYLARGTWFRVTSNVGALSIGGHVYLIGKSSAHREVEIRYEPQERHFILRGADHQIIKRVPIKGVHPHALMGELDVVSRMAPFQPTLPFAWRDGRMFQLLGPPRSEHASGPM
jgi:transposase InsO family protein